MSLFFYMDFEKSLFVEMLGVPEPSPEARSLQYRKSYENRRSDAEKGLATVRQTPRADPTRLTQMLDAAKLLADQGRFESAWERLETHRALATEEIQKAKQAVKKTREENQAKLQYEAVRVEVEKVDAQLASVPGPAATAAVKTLQSALKRANTAATAEPPDFVSAHEILKTADHAKVLKDAKTGTVQALERMPEVITQAYLKAREQLKEFRKIAPDNEIKYQSESLANFLNRAMDPSVTLAPEVKAESFRQAVSGMQERAQVLRDNQSEARRFELKAQGDISSLVEHAPPEQAAPFQLEFKTAVAHRERREFLTAKELFEALAAKTLEHNKRFGKQAQAWRVAETEAPKVRKKAADLAIQFPNHPEIAELAHITQIDMDRAYLAANEHDYGHAVEVYEQAKTRVEDFVSGFVGPHEKLNTAISDGEASISQKMREVDVIYQGLVRGMKEAKGKGEFLGELTTRPKEILDSWKKETERVTDPDVLKKMIADAIEQLGALGNKMTELSTQEGGIAGLVDSEKKHDEKAEAERLLTAQRSEFEVARGKAEKELELLAHNGGPLHTKLLKRFQTAIGHAASDYPAATREMTTIQSEANGATIAMQETCRDTAKLVNETATEVKRLIEEGKVHPKLKEFLPYFTDVEKELEEYRSMLLSGNFDAMLAAENHLKLIKSRVEGFLAEAKTAKGEVKRSQITLIPQFLDVIETKDLANEDLAKFAKSEKTELDNEFKELKTSARKLDPAKAIEEIADFKGRVYDLAQKVAGIKIQRENFDVYYERIKSQLGEVITNNKLEYYKKLEKQLQAALKQADAEGKVDAALKGLDSIRDELKTLSAIEDGNDRLGEVSKRELKTKEDIETAKQAQLNFDTDLGLFKEGDLAAVLLLAKNPNNDKGMIDTFKQFVDSIEKLGKSDVKKATEQLEQAKKQAVVIKANPQGSKGTARFNLPKDVANWKQAALAFDSSVKALIAEIRVASSETPETAAPVLAELTKLPDLFLTDEFSGPASQLGTVDVPERTRKAVREKMLRVVRRYRGYLFHDPLMGLLRTSPFETNLMGEMMRMKTCLDNLEFNSLTSI
jgi:hypothetical protein